MATTAVKVPASALEKARKVLALHDGTSGPEQQAAYDRLRVIVFEPYGIDLKELRIQLGKYRAGGFERRKSAYDEERRKAQEQAEQDQWVRDFVKDTREDQDRMQDQLHRFGERKKFVASFLYKTDTDFKILMQVIAKMYGHDIARDSVCMFSGIRHFRKLKISYKAYVNVYMEYIKHRRAYNRIIETAFYEYVVENRLF